MARRGPPAPQAGGLTEAGTSRCTRTRRCRTGRRAARRVIRRRRGRRLHLYVGDHVGDEPTRVPGEVVGQDSVVARREGERERTYLVHDAVAAGSPRRISRAPWQQRDLRAARAVERNEVDSLPGWVRYAWPGATQPAALAGDAPAATAIVTAATLATSVASARLSR